MENEQQQQQQKQKLTRITIFAWDTERKTSNFEHKINGETSKEQEFIFCFFFFKFSWVSLIATINPYVYAPLSK